LPGVVTLDIVMDCAYIDEMLKLKKGTILSIVDTMPI